MPDKGKKCVCLKSILHFVANRFRPNLDWLWIMSGEWHFCCLSYPTAMHGAIRTKIVSSWRIKCPSLLTDFNQTCTACCKWKNSSTTDVTVHPLQCEARQEWKPVLALWVKCTSLHTDFDQTCTACNVNAYLGLFIEAYYFWPQWGVCRFCILCFHKWEGHVTVI
jgi:hypothetical protein